MGAIKWIGLGIASLAALVTVAFGVARLHDGPLGPLPGGALKAGSLVTEPVPRWDFAADEDTIEMQLADEATSRTTWILVNAGAAYIPCSLGFPPGKTWYKRADRDGRALLRIQGKRYPVVLERVEDAGLATTLEEIVKTKYGGGPPSDAGVWFFAVTSRPGAP